MHFRSRRRYRILFYIGGVAEPAQLHPIVMEGYGLEPGSNRTEGVEIPVALPPPVRKAGTQPVGSPRPLQQIRLVDSEQAVQSVKGRKRDFADCARRGS